MAMPKGAFLTLVLLLLWASPWDGGFPPLERSSPHGCPQVHPSEGGSCTWGMWPHRFIPPSRIKGRTKASRLYAEGKVIYGLKEDKDFSVYAHFCYSRGRWEKGKKGVFIVTNFYIPNAKLLILEQTEQEMHSYVDGKNGNTCADLEKKALFLHPFDDIPPGDLKDSYFVYEGDVGDHLKGTQLSFVLLACGRQVKNAYKIEFRNNTHFLRNHFSCEEQGLIEIHLLLVVILGVLSLAYRAKQESLSRAHGALKEALHMAVIFFALSNICYLIHIFSFAFNGIGFTSLKVFSQINESIYDCLMLTIIFYIMGCTIDKERRREDTFRTSLTYGVLKFLYLLVEMQNQQELNLYASLHSVVALPFVAYRVVTAAMIYRNCKRLLMEKTPGEETFFILLQMFLLVNWGCNSGKLPPRMPPLEIASFFHGAPQHCRYNLWILAIPAYYLLMSQASV